MFIALVVVVLTGCGPEEPPAADAGSPCGPGTAQVARVVDGDTVELADGMRVRYLMVDTPESTGGNNECYGTESAEFNRSLVEGQTVSLRYDEQCQDRYGRTLAYVSIQGRDVNRLLIERGYACVLYIPPNGESVVSDYRAAQSEAKAAGRGLWGACTTNPCN